MFLGFTKEEWKEVLVEYLTTQLPFALLGGVLGALIVFFAVRMLAC